MTQLAPADLPSHTLHALGAAASCLSIFRSPVGDRRRAFNERGTNFSLSPICGDGQTPHRQLVELISPLLLLAIRNDASGVLLYVRLAEAVTHRSKAPPCFNGGRERSSLRGEKVGACFLLTRSRLRFGIFAQDEVLCGGYAYLISDHCSNFGQLLTFL